ncbi:tetratricopeptide (TPR) repeat protein [Scopulibacillus daqui]|uniref:Tetratricopeptide (TPR) repeat protein n=1 Tax=Scopulibacillus daqui TaxID=1469162 RepID=A0ABS2PZ90_9BACL|nr:tetratricopeptide repeat protein [Scopulibacillus daqui]MBM7645281.1 tetratricopeptide (TPR) repeat protein [Scopulibacillus daqui]
MHNISQAITLVETGQHEKGLQMLKEILKTADDETAYQIAECYQDWGLIEDAERIYERLLKTYPNDSHLLIQLAELNIDQDNEEKAIELLSKIHQLDENYLSAQLLLADLYQFQGLDEVAEKKLLDAYKISPNEPVLSFALGEFYLSVGEPSKAIPYYKQVLHAESLSHENVALKLAEALSLNGQFEEALIYYQKGLEKEKTLDGLFGLGMTAYQTGKFQTAITALEELKELDPQYSTLYPVLSQAYQQEGAEDEALAAIEEGIKVDEFNERLYLKAGELAAGLSQWDKAAHYYNQSLKINPDNIEALKHLIEIKYEQRDYEGIIHQLETEAIDDPTALWFMGKAYVQTEQFEKALEVYEKISSCFQDDPVFLGEYGELLWQSGDRKKALANLRKAAAFDPDNQDLQAFVERIEQDFY